MGSSFFLLHEVKAAIISKSNTILPYKIVFFMLANVDQRNIGQFFFLSNAITGDKKYIKPV
jgi:hypothetical protein